MKNFSIGHQLLTILFVFIISSCASNTATFEGEKVRLITVERELHYSADIVWDKIFMDYGGSHKFNVNVVESGYTGDIKTAKVGAQRYMQQDEEGKKILYERIEMIDANSKKMRFKIYDAKGIPINTDVTYGESQLIEKGENSSLFRINFYYRLKPSFLANFANSGLERDFTNMTIGMEHYLRTGEQISEDNFDEIASKYK
ncbi:MAG: hypothetical protein AAF741_00245 [Bacteroidota bacterium]